MELEKLNYADIFADIAALADKLPTHKYDGVYLVPKNGLCLGIVLSDALAARNKRLPFKLDIGTITDKTLIFDDLIDSGSTLGQWPNNDHAVLYRKPWSPATTYVVREIDKWIVFPFEEVTPAADSVIRILQRIGEDPYREGLKKTPERFLKMMDEMTAGYYEKPKDLFESVFTCENDQMVVVKDIDFHSLCEHHLVPFFGQVHIAYVPDGKVLGLSKFARLVEVYAKRLQIQENLTKQICDSLKVLKPKAAMVVIEAQHLCMSMRGIKKQNAVTVTSSISGVFRHDEKARAEALKLMGL